MVRFLSAVFMLLTAAGCGTAENLTEIPVVPALDVARYCGKWYEIARMPNFFEKDLTDVRAVYTLLENGKIQVVNSGIKAGKIQQIKGTAKFASKEKNGHLKVSFFRPFWSDYRIIMLKDDFSLACVMGKDRSLAWILARSPAISAAEIAGACDFLKSRRFPVDRLHFTRHGTP